MLSKLPEKVILGQPVTIHWDPNSIASKSLFLYRKKSFFFWKNYTRLKNNGSQQIIVDSKEFQIELCSLKLLGFRRLFFYKPRVRIISLKGIEMSAAIPENRAQLAKPEISAHKIQMSRKVPSFGLSLPNVKIHLTSIETID
jgi:hypothetical protein